jgi:hypothetical protein
MRLIAELTMPHNNSWNGRWSGENDKYTKEIKVGKKAVEKLKGNYYYNFGDGWGANVEIREAKLREKVTNKFCGYEWMVQSILMHGEIRAD